MPQPASSIREKLDGPILLVLARLIIPTITGAALIFLGFMGKRVIEVMDSTAKQVTEIHVSQATRDTFIADITRQRDGEYKSLKEVIADHEVRLRSVERQVVIGNRR